MYSSVKIFKGALVATTAAALVVNGAGVAGAATSHGRARVNFSVAKHGYAHAPSHTRPGRAHLHVKGGRGGIPVIVFKRKHKHDGATTLVKDFRKHNPTKLFKDFVFVAEAGDVYTTLSRGTYYAVAPFEHLSAAKVATFKVSGKRADAKVPASSTYRIDSHQNLHAPGSQSRHRLLHLVNSTSSPQNLFLLGLDKSVSQGDINAYLAHPSEKNLDKLKVVDVSTGGLTPAHRQLWTDAHLQARRYIAALLPVSDDSFTLTSPHLVVVK